MSDEPGATSATAPAAPPAGPRRRTPLRRWLPPLAAAVLVVTAWIVIANGAEAAGDEAQQYRYDRASWASRSAEVASSFASIDAIAAAQGLDQARFDDALAPAWSRASPQPCVTDASLVPSAGEVPALPSHPFGFASGAYASAAAVADRDAAAIAAFERLPDVIADAATEVDAVCSTAGSLELLQASAVRTLRDGLALSYLREASTDEIAYAVVEGTGMVTVRCDGVAGCTGIDLEAWGVVIADAWTEDFAWTAQSYADVYATCPASLAEPCAAVAAAHEARADAEQAIADAFRLQDPAAIDAAFQQRTVAWDAAWATAEQAIADAGGDSMEALLAQAWVTALEPVAECAQEAIIRW
ncbi:hypothetical protein GCM10009846_10620 [Agrococcus versicolor]|uniref:DUF1311 domain-containing protein n=1 Tax=Agrococcus versicolor TaxID=501482 RepID=A0ABN3AMS7_9MICO